MGSFTFSLFRYNFERLSNKLGRVTKLNFRDPLEQGYFPKLDSLVSSRNWPARMANVKLSVGVYFLYPECFVI